ncbi:hypothetical protein K490DRAFT_75167 [Saccharata proteae CBS 121410]|uniref:Dienelactone hydrolase n=1 Tax=Saccharata proteae CBS 121410 TaxID=1314787 RepID=A0A9P4HRW2_9PEZI|nr:hypothetical protein K490DRAFT_75167 [Saccharata proteae CBS 121410]
MVTLPIRDHSFLAWNAATPKVYITAESDDFDEYTIQAWAEEGFDVTYVPFRDGGKQYVKTLHSLGENLGVGGQYAVVAFGDAASVCLETFIRQTPKLAAIIAYYPSSIPDPQTRFAPSLRVLVHLAGRQIGVNRNSEILGIQGKRRTITKKITPGIGMGGTQKLSYPCYTYQNVEAGFAEHDLEDYDKIADALAWSRSLATMRQAFGAELNIERVWEENEEYKFHNPNTQKIMSTMTTTEKPEVVYTPTMTGGRSHDDLSRFYSEFFIPSIAPKNPQSIRLKTRLLSRTIGADRVVDELFVAFKHTQEMPWILPGIPPTNLPVELIMVSIVAIKGGKLVSEHVYWDQASVLVQVGLIDIDNVPEQLSKKGVKELPIFGEESAREIVGGGEPLNELIEDW